MGSHIAIVLCDSGSECHSTKSSHAFQQNWDTKQPVSSIYPTISCKMVLNPARLNPPCLNPPNLKASYISWWSSGVGYIQSSFSSLVLPPWYWLDQITPQNAQILTAQWLWLEASQMQR